MDALTSGAGTRPRRAPAWSDPVTIEGPGEEFLGYFRSLATRAH